MGGSDGPAAEQICSSSLVYLLIMAGEGLGVEDDETIFLPSSGVGGGGAGSSSCKRTISENMPFV
jgi:hypothetical protein